MTIKTLLAAMMTTGQTLLALPQDFIDPQIVENARIDLSQLRANPEIDRDAHVFANAMANVLGGFDGVDLTASDEDWRTAYQDAIVATNAYFAKLERQVRHLAANAVAQREAGERRAARKAARAVAHQARMDKRKADALTRKEERIAAHQARIAAARKPAPQAANDVAAEIGQAA